MNMTKLIKIAVKAKINSLHSRLHGDNDYDYMETQASRAKDPDWYARRDAAAEKLDDFLKLL